jgi:hypothetical protein
MIEINQSLLDILKDYKNQTNSPLTREELTVIGRVIIDKLALEEGLMDMKEYENRHDPNHPYIFSVADQIDKILKTNKTPHTALMYWIKNNTIY